MKIHDIIAMIHREFPHRVVAGEPSIRELFRQATKPSDHYVEGPSGVERVQCVVGDYIFLPGVTAVNKNQLAAIIAALLKRETAPESKPKPIPYEELAKRAHDSLSPPRMDFKRLVSGDYMHDSGTVISAAEYKNLCDLFAMGERKRKERGTVEEAIEWEIRKGCKDVRDLFEPLPGGDYRFRPWGHWESTITYQKVGRLCREYGDAIRRPRAGSQAETPEERASRRVHAAVRDEESRWGKL